MVDLSGGSGDEVVCFAPPGTSLYGEHGLELATWRRGVWTSEGEFLSRRSPLAVDAISFPRAVADIPGDFSDWVRYETAAHVEMLRAFAARRPSRTEVTEAARRLSEEMESFEPEVMERCRAEVDVFIARTELRRLRELQDSASEAEASSIGRLLFRRLPVEAVLMLAFYAVYRLIRPAGPVSGLKVPLDQPTPGAVFDVLMWIYGNVHVVALFLFMGWVFFKHPGAFRYVRNAAIVAAVIAVIPYLLLHTSTYAPNSDHEIPASAVPTMPALHLAIGVMIGIWGLLLCRGSIARILWGAYPLLALGAVIASQPRDPGLTIAWALFAVILGLAAATLAGQLRNRWRGPPLPPLRLVRLPSLPLRHF
jgi:hypothetical protein